MTDKSTNSQNQNFYKIITATELKNKLGKILDYVMEDNEVIVTKNGRKAVRITSYINDYDRYFVLREKALDYMYSGKKVSYEEFMEIYEKSDLRMEFINGEIIILHSPGIRHQEISGDLYVIFKEYLKDKKCKVFYAPFDVHLYKAGFKDPDVVQPDLLIACDTEEEVNEKGRYMGTPALVVEILSPGTRSRDMVDKLNTYMISGVKEFWIVDPDSENILIYNFEDNKIKYFISCKKEDIAQSFYFEGLQVKVSEVL
ncbi:MAG: type II toxin-antitoxin system prevent-host-death family antitoxin [Clostridiaceae bacterium]|nr:type II toxin-antitoxin system prevent-host-death family antitoxin [Clostridiaceae bacterium]